MANKAWQLSDLKGAKNVGPVCIGEEHFEVLQTPTKLVFGGFCNAGFLESGFLAIDEGEHPDDACVELVADLETFYRDGAQYVSRIVCNERM